MSQQGREHILQLEFLATDGLRAPRAGVLWLAAASPPGDGPHAGQAAPRPHAAPSPARGPTLASPHCATGQARPHGLPNPFHPIHHVDGETEAQGRMGPAPGHPVS